MGISVGIIGLPNVGKSTLFNALLKKQAALTANYPFTTIEPNIGVVELVDDRMTKLTEMIKSKSKKPTTVKFVDIAGLVEGAHKGEGLGNKFLSHIRQVDAIVHVLRDFEDENIVHTGPIDPKSDAQIVNTELILADIQVLENRIRNVGRLPGVEDTKVLKTCQKLVESLNKGNLASEAGLLDDEINQISDLNLITLKPVLHVFNISENKVTEGKTMIKSTDSIRICAQLEVEICDFSTEKRLEYLQEIGFDSTGLERLITHSYKLLDLITFYTIKGGKEVSAWSIKRDTLAPQAAGKIHTDFERGFISCEVVPFSKLESAGNWLEAKQKGFVRLEGKNYKVKDGDVIEFRFSV